MRAAAAALLSLWLVGCAPAATHTNASTRFPSPPISRWETGENATAETMLPTPPTPQEAESEPRDGPAPAPQAEPTTEQPEQAMQDGSGLQAGEPLPFGGIEPEVVHRARIEMARAALVEENQNKERVDLAEELQRELAALQASAQTSKSRVRHGGPTKKQP